MRSSAWKKTFVRKAWACVLPAITATAAAVTTTTAAATTVAAFAAAFTTFVAATATAATATTAAITTTAAWTIFLRTSFIDGQHTAAKVFAVEFTNGSFHCGSGVHSDKSETTWAATVTIHGKVNIGHGSMSREKVAQFGFSGTEGEIPHIHLRIHKQLILIWPTCCKHARITDEEFTCEFLDRTFKQVGRGSF